MRAHFLVLGAADWSRKISLCSATDQIVSEDSALAMAEEFIQTNKEPYAYVYKLHKVFRPRTEREVEEVLVDADEEFPEIQRSKEYWLGLGAELRASYGGSE